MPGRVERPVMTYVCRHCGRTFSAALDLDLHHDRCVDDTLVCRSCGERFAAARATTDGWHYRCPTEGCDAAGIGEGLRRLVRPRATH